MSYQVHITSTAEHDIMRAADYIEFTLKNPDAADNLLDAATEQISSLADLPQKFRLVDDPVLASWGIRFVIINNFLTFYTIDEEKQTVIHSPHNIVFCGRSDMNLIVHRLRRFLISAIASENGLILPVEISSIPSLIWL